MIKSVLRRLARLLFHISGLNRASRISCNLSEMLNPIFRIRVGSNAPFLLYCPNVMSLWRAQFFFDKEPETIRWISSFESGETLLDVGANIGMYTLFAANRGHRVVAVEPESQNFAVLNRNIFLNQFYNTVTAYNLALSDLTKQSALYLSSFGAASALHTVGKPIDYRHQPMKPEFRQGIMELTLDQFLAGISDFFPDHIKIDVDGAEARIVSGAAGTLKNSRLKSVLIEINEELEVDREIIGCMRTHSFLHFQREHSHLFESGPFSKSFNYIFTR